MSTGFKVKVHVWNASDLIPYFYSIYELQNYFGNLLETELGENGEIIGFYTTNANIDVALATFIGHHNHDLRPKIKFL